MEDEKVISENEKELVKSILSQVWRVQYRIVGNDSVDKLYDGVQNGDSLDNLVSFPEGGDSMDLSSAWEILYQAVGLTVNVIVLYKTFKQEHNRPPSQEELSQKVKDSGILSNFGRNVRKKEDSVIKNVIIIYGSVGGNINSIQGDNNSAVQGNNNQLDVDVKTPQNKDDIVRLLEQLEALVLKAELPEETKEEVSEDISAAKKATDKNEPKKNIALANLENVAQTLEKTSKTVDAGQKLWNTAKPIIVKIASWLGATASSYLLNL